MYYRLYDRQTGCYMHTGYNAKNKKELKDQLLDYIAPDVEENEEDEIKLMTAESICSAWDFVIEKQKNKFEDINLLN